MMEYPNRREIREIHKSAMIKAEWAIYLSRHGLHDVAREWFIEAMNLETSAAEQATSEPTKSILCRSAAALAVNAGECKKAVELAQLGLHGSPPFDIQRELLQIIKQAKAGR